MATSGTAKVRPVHEIRMGRIRAAIWENETQMVRDTMSPSVACPKDGDEWKDSSTFGRDDLHFAVKVLDQARSWIFPAWKFSFGLRKR